MLKKPLAALLVLSMVTAILAASLATYHANGQQQNPWGQQFGPQYGQAPPGAGPLSLPGINIPGLVQGSNSLALSISIASQEQNKIYFLVNAFAVIDQSSQSASVYQLSQALPGVIDTQTNDVQIDFGNLQSVMGSPQQASVNDLYRLMRPSVNSIMVNVVATPTQTSGGRTTFQLQDISMILPDGTQETFNMQQQISAVYDQSSMRMYTVAFPQLYNVVNTFVTNVQNNYYTTVIYNIVPAAPIVVSPPILYPTLVPITFPAVWPIFYPVPVPVPFPTMRPSITPRPTVSPTMKPTVSPTKMPTVSPTTKPTVSPTTKPTISPTKIPTISPTRPPTTSPTVRPSITARPTISVTTMPTISPTVKPTIKISPTPSPRSSLRPAITTRASLIPSLKPTIKPTAIASIRAAPVVTHKPPSGGAPSVQRPVITARAPGRMTATEQAQQIPARHIPARTP